MSDPGSHGRADVRRAVGSLVTASVIVAGVALLVVLVALFAAPGAVAVLLSAALGPRDGGALARANVEQSVSARVDRLGYWYEPTDAETLASERLSGIYGSAEFTPFAWSGTTARGEGAIVDVLVSSRVAAQSAVSIGQRGTTAGSAEACFRFTFPETDFVRVDPLACPSGLSALSAPTPTPTVRPKLPDDARATIAAILKESPGEAAASALPSAFDDPAFTVEFTTTNSGERVVAVGAPASGDCILMVERTDGTLDEPGFDPTWILPGETGCSTQLYTSPPL